DRQALEANVQSAEVVQPGNGSFDVASRDLELRNWPTKGFGFAATQSASWEIASAPSFRPKNWATSRKATWRNFRIHR
ncbi:MAG TPA: hypothetical protein PKE50_10450, partial [Rhodocyclaceae bacterium]|nr:hypothetical protein [Rhodocyclaceae bacterium]